MLRAHTYVHRSHLSQAHHWFKLLDVNILLIKCKRQLVVTDRSLRGSTVTVDPDRPLILINSWTYAVCSQLCLRVSGNVSRWETGGTDPSVNFFYPRFCLTYTLLTNDPSEMRSQKPTCSTPTQNFLLPSMLRVISKPLVKVSLT